MRWCRHILAVVLSLIGLGLTAYLICYATGFSWSGVQTGAAVGSELAK